ncbi:hypothetical protein AAMO2058_000472500 [Amorphochlora amoebiformis]
MGRERRRRAVDAGLSFTMAFRLLRDTCQGCRPLVPDADPEPIGARILGHESKKNICLYLRYSFNFGDLRIFLTSSQYPVRAIDAAITLAAGWNFLEAATSSTCDPESLRLRLMKMARRGAALQRSRTDNDQNKGFGFFEWMQSMKIWRGRKGNRGDVETEEKGAYGSEGSAENIGETEEGGGGFLWGMMNPVRRIFSLSSSKYPAPDDPHSPPKSPTPRRRSTSPFVGLSTQNNPSPNINSAGTPSPPKKLMLRRRSSPFLQHRRETLLSRKSMLEPGQAFAALMGRGADRIGDSGLEVYGSRSLMIWLLRIGRLRNISIQVSYLFKPKGLGRSLSSSTNLPPSLPLLLTHRDTVFFIRKGNNLWLATGVTEEKGILRAVGVVRNRRDSNDKCTEPNKISIDIKTLEIDIKGSNLSKFLSGTQDCVIEVRRSRALHRSSFSLDMAN